MNPSPHPISRNCPQCRSTRHKKVDPDWQPAIVNDRICHACGTRYSPPPPAILASFVYVLGAGSIAAECWFLYRFFFHDDAMRVNPGWAAMMILFGIIALTVWVRRPASETP